jgi:membrane protein YqaA with SNARE-associated domain
MKKWFENLNIYISQLAETKWGTLILFISAFADASVLPLPVTTYFLILILLNTRMIYKNILLVVGGTVAGAVAGYSVGHFAWFNPDGDFTTIVQFLFKNIPGFSVNVYDKVHVLYTKWDFWILGLATATPLPYGMFSVSAGVFNLNIFIFFFTTLISQSIKYSFLALFATVLGPKIRILMQSDLKRIIVIAAAFIIIAIILSNSL